MNKLQERELETFEQDDRFKVTDLDSANWVLRNWMQSQLKRTKSTS